MAPETLFRIHFVLGYVAWRLCFGAYIWPRLKLMHRIETQRAIAALHSFRIFGLVLYPSGCRRQLACGFCHLRRVRRPRDRPAGHDGAFDSRDSSALLRVCYRFNLVGVADLMVDYFNATVLGLPAHAGELGAT